VITFFNQILFHFSDESSTKVSRPRFRLSWQLCRRPQVICVTQPVQLERAQRQKQLCCVNVLCVAVVCVTRDVIKHCIAIVCVTRYGIKHRVAIVCVTRYGIKHRVAIVCFTCDVPGVCVSHRVGVTSVTGCVSRNSFESVFSEARGID
jgi:hypothetical protein